ncbi:MAG: SDR family NAD(P)-dependent oxidoreductase, partial [Frankiaceae bacterium]
VYWLTALDDEGPVANLDSDGWHDALHVRVKNLAVTMKRLYDDAPFLVAGTRLGGLHGYEADGALCPLGGAVTGFVKAYKREQTEVLVKAVDFPASRKSAALADRLIEETLTDPGCVEVGGGEGTRWSIGLAEQPAADGNPSFDMHGGTIYVVTGAAGSIVSAITADLATHGGGGIFHLLDLTPTPDENDADLRTYIADRDALKADLIARAKAAGEKVTPVIIDKELARIERLSMAQAAIEAVRSAGGQAIYHSVNLTDGPAVQAVISEIAAAHGRIDILLHAAGLEISKRLKNKDMREYDLVFDVKSDGWFNLLRAIGDLPVGATVAFSSVAGRFGNLGQTDYSAANDLLCKLTSNLRRSRQNTRGIVLDWTAWGGIGMATRGSIPTIMAAAGIDMLPADAGIATIRRELTAGGTRGELVVAGALGVMTTEFDETGGLDTSRVDVAAAGPMVGQVTGMGVWSGLTVETTLDPAAQPFLNDHRIDGTALLPGVMGVEAFAEVARLLVPGWHVADIEDVDFSEPFKFYRDEPRTLTIRATLSPADGGLAARCELIGSRTLATRPEPVVTVHFTGTVRLRESEPEAEQDGVESMDGRPAVGHDAVYAIYFHGPAYQVLDEAWRTGAGAAGRFAAGLPANHEPQERATVAEPRLIELCFQTAGIEEMGTTGLMGLPAHIDRVHFPAHVGVDDALVAEADPRGDGVFDARVVDGTGRVLLRLVGYRTATLPGQVDGTLLGPLRAAMAPG